jgi:AraC-like DNA-binding protein
VKSASRSKAQATAPQDAHAGLFRAWLGGPGATLKDVFTGLESGPAAPGIFKHPNRNLIGTRWQLPDTEGAGFYELTRIGDDVFVIGIDVSYKDPRLEAIPGDGLVQFYFKLSGDLTLGVSRKEPLRLHRPSLLVYNQPAGVDFQEWTAPSARERGVAITLRPQYLIEQLLSGNDAAPAQLRAIAAGKPNRFQFVQLRLSSQMFELASKLVDNPYSEPTLRLLYTEAVTLQLLCAAVQGFKELASDPSEEYSDRDLRCLNAARALLTKQFSPVPTIRQVARAAGMNETSLKQGFKSVFGETLYDFSVRCRMQNAMKLLQEGRMPVARISEAVGYAHQTSFATAFRSHFGVTPREVKPQKHK